MKKPLETYAKTIETVRDIRAVNPELGIIVVAQEQTRREDRELFIPADVLKEVLNLIEASNTLLLTKALKGDA